MPGLGLILGVRVLGEFGDDPTRFSDAASRRAYAGSAPITRVSGKLTLVLLRRAGTSGCPRPAAGGRSPPPNAHLAPRPTTNATATPETIAKPPCDEWPTNCSSGPLSWSF
ncbi:MAG: transposase [Pseudonocardiaceae bacterium]